MFMLYTEYLQICSCAEGLLYRAFDEQAACLLVCECTQLLPKLTHELKAKRVLGLWPAECEGIDTFVLLVWLELGLNWRNAGDKPAVYRR